MEIHAGNSPRLRSFVSWVWYIAIDRFGAAIDRGIKKSYESTKTPPAAARKEKNAFKKREKNRVKNAVKNVVADRSKKRAQWVSKIWREITFKKNA